MRFLSLCLAFATSALAVEIESTTASCTNLNYQQCPATYEPVCGKNLVAYVNKCNLDISRCRNSTVEQSSTIPGPFGYLCNFKTTTRPTVLLVGDSITRRGFDPSLGGWGARLAYTYSPAIDVVNRGMGGYTTKWMLEFGMTDLIVSMQKFKPDLITFWLGTNDGAPTANASVPAVPLDQFRLYHTKIIEAFKTYAPQAKLLLIAAPPVKNEIQTAFIKANGAVVKEIAASKKLDFVDLFEAFTTAYPDPTKRDVLWVDGIHLTAIGNDIAFKTINAKLPSMFPPNWFTDLQEPIPEKAGLIA